MPSYAGKVAALRSKWGAACVWCGAPHLPAVEWFLEFAHLPGKPTRLDGLGRGQANRYHDIKNNPGSYVLLCREHHVALDGRGGRGTGWTREEVDRAELEDDDDAA